MRPSIQNYLLLGVDGGGSKTRALLADPAGNVLASYTATASNCQVVGFEAATRAIKVAIDGARAQLDPVQWEQATVGAACLGLAGADRAPERARFEAWARGAGIARCVVVVNDAELLLAAGSVQGWGLALICGTGAICYGRAMDGRTARAGGWGYLLGDEGSGYDIGREALRLATQTADGRARAHAILRLVLEHWALAEPVQLIGRLYGLESVQTEVAALAPAVAALARDGDLDAGRIIERAAGELARLVDAVAQTLNLNEPALVLGGGLLAADEGFRAAILGQLRRKIGATTAPDPARGAVAIARRTREECNDIAS